jgi:hypothetical protein
MRYASLAVGALLLAVLACSPEDSRLPSEPSRSNDEGLDAQLSSVDQTSLTDKLAGLIAQALRSPDMRALVRDAMRKSRVTEHKLVLQDFALTPAGNRLVAALGVVSQTGTAQVTSWIKSLPRLDFYMPSREHRLAWRGGVDAAVAANVSSTPPRTAYAVSGGSIPIQLSAFRPSAAALFMLQREEYKNKRIRPQRDVPGAAIQEPDDGTMGITYIETDAQGRTKVTEAADLVEAAALSGGRGPNLPCTEPLGPQLGTPSCGGGGGGGGGGGVHGVFLKRIDTDHICDNANCSEGNEFEFFAKSASGSTKTTRITDIPSTGRFARNDVIFYSNPFGAGTITISTKETDFSSGDDIWDYVTYQPNYQGPIPLTTSDNNKFWYLKERPSGVFTPYRLALYLAW